MATASSDSVKETDGGGEEGTTDRVDEGKGKGDRAICKVKLDRRSHEEKIKEGNANSKSRRKERRARMHHQDNVHGEREGTGPGGAEEAQDFKPSKEGPGHPKYEEKNEYRSERDKHSDRRHDDHGYYDRGISGRRKDEDGRDYYGKYDYGGHRHQERYDERYRDDGRQRYDGSDKHTPRHYRQDERQRYHQYGEGHRRRGGGGPRRRQPEPTLPPGVDSFKLKKCDLFDSPLTSSLAHCVSEDMHMGKGIAVAFRKKFKRVDQLLGQDIKTGGVAVLEDHNRYIYYLVTKRKYYHKPTNETLRRSLLAMKERILANKVKELHMPLIGCGLDELDWYTDVAYMIHEIFKEIKDLEITVCYLGE